MKTYEIYGKTSRELLGMYPYANGDTDSHAVMHLPIYLDVEDERDMHQLRDYLAQDGIAYEWTNYGLSIHWDNCEACSRRGRCYSIDPAGIPLIAEWANVPTSSVDVISDTEVYIRDTALTPTRLQELRAWIAARFECYEW